MPPQQPNPTASLMTLLALQAALGQQNQTPKQQSPIPTGLLSGLTGSSGGSVLGNALSSWGAEAPMASYNIPASYLPSVSSSAPEVISSTTPSILANAGSMGVLPLAAIAGATFLGGKSAYNMLRGKEDKSLGGKIGRVSLGIATGGLSEVGKKLFGHKSTKQYQRERDDALSKINADYANFHQNTLANRDRANSAAAAQAADFVGFDPNGIWVNNKYKNTGDLNSLTENDITGSQAFFERDPNWLKKSLEERNKIARKYLDAKAIGSSKGMITLDDSKVKLADTMPLQPMFKQPTSPQMPTQSSGLLPGSLMKNGKRYISPGVYR